MNNNFIPVNDLSRVDEQSKTEISAAITKVLNSGSYILGAELEKFEKNFAEFLNSKYAIGVANGTEALEIALRAIGIGAGDEVLTVANAGGYSTNAIYKVGATPRYIDVNEETALIDLFLLKKYLQNNQSGQIKALIITHLYGNAVDMNAVMELRQTFNIAVIEDCAQSLGAELNQKKIGSFGDISCHSFFPTKNLGAIGDGGAVVTSNQTLADKFLSLRQYGWIKKYEVVNANGLNSRLDEIQATVLNYKLKTFENDLQKRIRIMGEYTRALNKTPAITTWNELSLATGHLAVIQVPNRDHFINYLSLKNIGTSIHYPILDHKQPAWRSTENFRLGISEFINKRIVTIPLFAGMTDAEVLRVCDAIASPQAYS